MQRGLFLSRKPSRFFSCFFLAVQLLTPRLAVANGLEDLKEWTTLLLEAIYEGTKTEVPGGEFVTLAENLPAASMGLYDAFLFKEEQTNERLQRETQQRLDELIDSNGDPEAIKALRDQLMRLRNQARALRDLRGRVAAAKQAAAGRHEKEGSDPWLATFIVDPGFVVPTVAGRTSIGTATIDTSQPGIAAWIVPKVWGGGSVQQQPTGSISFSATLLDSGDLQVVVDPFSFSLPPFPINVPNYTDTGENVTSFPGGTFVATKIQNNIYTFNSALIGTFTNNTAPPDNPGIEMDNISGLFFQDQQTHQAQLTVEAVSTLLVPGPTLPGQLPIIYTASRASFDPSVNAVRFSNPFDGSGALPVMAADAVDGSFVSVATGHPDPLLHAHYVIGDLHISQRIGTQISFTDTPFTISTETDILASGTFSDIVLDTYDGDFLAHTTNVQLSGASALLGEFFDRPHVYLLMAPFDALKLLNLSDSLSGSVGSAVGFQEITLLNHNSTAPMTYRLSGGGKYLASGNVSELRVDLEGTGESFQRDQFRAPGGGTLRAFNYSTRTFIDVVSVRSLDGTLFDDGDLAVHGVGDAAVNGGRTSVDFVLSRTNGVVAFEVRDAETMATLAGGTGEAGRAALEVTITRQ